MKMLRRFATLAAIASVAAFQSLAEVETVTSSATTFAFYGNPEKAYSSLPSQGGVWTLVNSVEGTARVGIPWAVFNDGGTYGASATAGFVADMVQTGPDRKLMKREAPLVAYSGDDWHGDLSKASTITFTPPEGSELAATMWNKTGTGAPERAGRPPPRTGETPVHMLRVIHVDLCAIFTVWDSEKFIIIGIQQTAKEGET